MMDKGDQDIHNYWAIEEPRVTGLTLKIMAANAATLLILLFGLLYLGQYQERLIEAKLETFGSEVKLAALALSENDVIEQTRLIDQLSLVTKRPVIIFNQQGELIKQSVLGSQISHDNGKTELKSVTVLKNIYNFAKRLLPHKNSLPVYPDTHPDMLAAVKGTTSFSVWAGDKSDFLLSAAAPLIRDGTQQGAILMMRDGADIEAELSEAWLNVMRIFIGALVLTIALSVYLAGLIAQPLKKLSRAADQVRRAKPYSVDIPDFSDRHDEIGDLSVVLREMTHALWKRMDSIDAFAADVAHELKNPLTSLRSAVETLPIAKTKANREKLVGIINHDIARLDRLITDISRASRLDAELSRADVALINLYDFMEDLVNLYRMPLERDGEMLPVDKDGDAIFEIKMTDQVLRVHGDDLNHLYIVGSADKLMQVFENLIANAVSFSSEGGVIEIHVSSTDKIIQISVEDEGIGIPADKLEDIFKRFYTERPEDERYGQNSGLGLSIASQIIESMSGRIYAENVNNKKGAVSGARFVISLPKV